MPQVQDVKTNLQTNTDSWNSVAEAIDYAGGDSSDYVYTYGDEIKKIVDNKNAKIDMIEAENKDLKITKSAYETDLLEINNAILSKGVSPTGGSDTYAEAILEIGGDEVVINLQDKETTPTKEEQIITPDAGFTGMSSVKVGAIKLQTKQVTPTLEKIEVVPDDDSHGLDKVVVDAVTSDIDENIKPENIVEGVEILGVIGSHVCESGSDGEVVEPVLVELNVTPTNEVQVFTPAEGEDGYNKVTVDAIPEGSGGVADPVLSPLEVTPSTETQEFTPAEGVDGFYPVTVKKVDASIDSNIRPENIRIDTEILGVVGTFAGTGDAKEINNADYICYNGYRSIDDYVNLIKNCTSFNYAFYQCDLTADSYNFDLSQATSWNEWLYQARSSSKEKDTTLNVVVGTKIDNMFYRLNYHGNANNLVHIYLSKTADKILTSAQNITNNANYIGTLDFGNIFDGVESINCNNMLARLNQNNSYKADINLTSLDFSKINNANTMFGMCNAKIILGDVNMTGIDCQYMFYVVDNLEYNNALNFTNCNLQRAFNGFSKDTLKINIQNDGTVNSNNSQAFDSSKLVSITSDEPWNLVPNCGNMFYYSNLLVSVPEINVHIVGSNRDNIGNMCQGCSSLEEIKLNIIYDNPNTYWRLYCENLFNGCSKLKKITGLDLSGQYQHYNSIFAGNTSLEEIIGKGTLAGYNTTTASMTWDLSASTVFRPYSWLNSLDANPDGLTRIIKLHADVYSALTEEVIALATEKNYTLASA